MLPITLFRLLFCYFRFNRNTETLCFGIEAKQLKQTSSSGSSFSGFKSKLVSKDTLIYRGKICPSHGPWLGRTVDSGIGLSYRPARLRRPTGYISTWAGGPVRQPYAGVNYITHSGTMNLASFATGFNCGQKINRSPYLESRLPQTRPNEKSSTAAIVSPSQAS
jgi:hypothetical protein